MVSLRSNMNRNAMHEKTGEVGQTEVTNCNKKLFIDIVDFVRNNGK